MRTIIVILTITLALSLPACTEDCVKAKANELRNVLNRELKVGDARDKVHEVLGRAKIVFSYDQFSNRYQGNFRDANCDPKQSVVVHIYINAMERVSKIEVRASYTWF